MRRCQFYSAGEYPQRWPLWRGTHHRVAGGCTGPNHAGEPGLGVDHRTFGQTALGLRPKEKPGSFAVHGAAYALTEAQRQGMAVRARVGGVEKSLHVFPPRYWHHGVLGWSAVQDGAIHSVPLVLANAYGGSQWPDNPQGMGHVSEAAAAHGVRLAPLGSSPAAGAAVLTPEQRAATASFLPLPPPAHTTAAVFGRAGCRLGSPAGPLLACGYRCCAGWTKVAQEPMPQHLLARQRAWEVVGMHPADPRSAGICRVCAGLFVQYADPAVPASEGTAGSGYRLAVSRR